MLPADEQKLVCEFGQGQRASDLGLYLSDNPHAYETPMYEAWKAGWHESEGPGYVLSPRLFGDRRTTLADIWPAA
jgi:hypothetical protein